MGFAMKRKVRTYSGVATPEVSARELESRKLARQAAAEGVVLLKNDGVLPISGGAKVVLYGNGAAHMIKGGTGSGDVNEREVVSILEGLVGAGLEVLNGAEVAQSEKDYVAARYAWRDMLAEKMAAANAGSGMNSFEVYISNPFIAPEGAPIVPAQAKEADAVIYMISRIAGEGADRFNKEGDYYLTEKEKKELSALSEISDKIIVIINAGGQVDTTEILANKGLAALVNMSQLGMETGNALADVLTGKVNPSAKLTSTWTKNYSDFPNSATFSHNNGDVENEKYEEGIYVGYRYFDSFGVEVEYPFGFGLSYTTFALVPGAVSVTESTITAEARVTNTGKVAGKEVVQVYAACPQEAQKKEAKKLIGFGKTDLLAPGESQTLTITMPAKTVASFDEEKAAWIVEKGTYGILVGKSSASVEIAGLLAVAEDAVIETVPHILPLQTELVEIERPDAVIAAFTAEWKAAAEKKGLAPICFAPAAEIVQKVPANELDAEAAKIAAELSDEEIMPMLLGEISKGQDNLKDNELVATGIFVPGAAGETSAVLEEKYDVPGVSMADGPAGLRLLRSYDVDRASGLIYSQGLMAALDGGLFAQDFPHENVDTYYQYATAIPIGTALAQTWNPALLEEVGAMVGGEMVEFGVAWWLAPGLNIHRNPLCGRNFEYYSEDPLVSGMMAAAITRGVQSVPGVGTTIKHFACNNQEDNRMGSNSIVSERALREIYLKGFEIAIKSSQPMCIMTSYNLVNSVHTANSYDLCTEAARNEWDFQGVIMTDWTTTTAGGSKPHGCALAGNDLIMPGNQIDCDDIMAALASGELPRDTARACVARMIKVLVQTLGMEDAPAYGAQFDLDPYVIVK